MKTIKLDKNESVKIIRDNCEIIIDAKNNVTINSKGNGASIKNKNHFGNFIGSQSTGSGNINTTISGNIDDDDWNW